MANFKTVSLTILSSWQVRNASRLCALFALAATILHGASRSGAFDSDTSFLNQMPGRLASLVGMAGDDIQIAGLDQHDPAEIMAALHLKSGGSLIGFDAETARTELEQITWVKSASVAREYPNALRDRKSVV